MSFHLIMCERASSRCASVSNASPIHAPMFGLSPGFLCSAATGMPPKAQSRAPTVDFCLPAKFCSPSIFGIYCAHSSAWFFGATARKDAPSLARSPNSIFSQAPHRLCKTEKARSRPGGPHPPLPIMPRAQLRIRRRARAPQKSPPRAPRRPLLLTPFPWKHPRRWKQSTMLPPCSRWQP